MVLLLLHLVATCFMTGVIWIIQVVHYPLFAHVGIEGYAEYQRLHMRKISWVVMPAMLFELGTAVALLAPQVIGVEVLVGTGNMSVLLWTNFLLLCLIWLSTVFLQVPQHSKLTKGFNVESFYKLKRWNWIRTIIWSLRAALLFYLAMSA